MKKYNIALLPSTKCDDFVRLSNSFSMLLTQYQLGPRSLPHITLCQFYANESDVDKIWTNVCSLLDIKSINLEFKIFSCISFDGKIFWVSLIPDEVTKLIELNSTIKTVIEPCTSRLYDPHLTLISTEDSAYESKAEPILKECTILSDTFILTIGECDELGQFTQLINQAKVNQAKEGEYLTYRM